MNDGYQRLRNKIRMDEDAQKIAVGMKNMATELVSRTGGPSAWKTAAILGAGAGTAGLVDAAINDPTERVKSGYQGLEDFLNVNQEVGSVWNYIHGDEALAPVEKQSLAKILTGKGGDVDAAILAETGAYGRAAEVMARRPDLAPVLGIAMQREVDLNVTQIDNGISNSEVENSGYMNHMGPLMSGMAAGGLLTGVNHALAQPRRVI